MIFVKNDGSTSRFSKNDWDNVKAGRYDSVGRQDLTVDGNILPKTDTSFNLGAPRQRFSRLFVASTIDVSGSELVIAAPSASAAGNSFNVVLSGSMIPADSDNDSIGSEEAPFKDLYVTTGSIIYVDRSVAVGHADRKVSFSRTDVERLRAGKPLRATDSRDDTTKIKTRMTGGIEVSGSFTLSGSAVSQNIQTFTAGDTTPSVAGGNIFKTANTLRAAADITQFDDGAIGQKITVIVSDAFTDFTHDIRRLYLCGGRDADALTTGDTIEFIYDGSKWYETNRSDNT